MQAKHDELLFAIWGGFLAAVVLLVVHFDADRLHRPGHVLAGIGVCGLLRACNWLGEELCARPDCRGTEKIDFRHWLASMSLLGAGLIWFDLVA